VLLAPLHMTIGRNAWSPCLSSCPQVKLRAPQASMWHLDLWWSSKVIPLRRWTQT